VEYKDRVLQRITHSEGSVSRNDQGAYEHEYVLRDHLGNTRVTFTDSNNDGIVTTADIKQINHYYPFGLNMEGDWNGAQGKNQYQYNGKELNQDFGLGWNDYGKRFYDPAIGRWTAVDSMSEHPFQIDKSPYAYAWDNPVKLTDPDGHCPFCPAIIEGGVTAYRVYRTYRAVEWVAKAAGVTIRTPEPIAALSALSRVQRGRIIPDASATVRLRPIIVKSDEKVTNETDKKPEGYTVDRELPKDKDGNPQPEPDAEGSHTQLGVRTGRKDTYRKAREFDENGKPVKDIEFTDHGRPKNHTNPHQHRIVPNQTGGTPKRLDAEPLD
jgi:RHS repeat-associated protein